MEVPPVLQSTPRATRDIRNCVDFVASQPWGRPADRKRDIAQGIKALASAPLRRRVAFRPPGTRLEFRCREAGQFVIIYAYTRPTRAWPTGRVSIRAVRHRRVRDILRGVRETRACYGGGSLP